MDLVIDANILFSVLIQESKTEDLIFLEDIHLFSPEFIFEEFEKYKEIILEKTERNKEDFEKLMNILKKKISLISNKETEFFFFKAKEISPDEKDVDYFALALKLKCPIWSNDKNLRDQNIIKIYSTEELIRDFNF